MAKRATKPEALVSETFGERLIRLRLAAGYKTTSDLARAIWGDKPDDKGFLVAANRDTIWRYEQNKAQPSKKNRELLCAALNMTIEELNPEWVEQPKAERTIVQQKALDQPNQLRMDVISQNERLLTIHMRLPASLADPTFEALKAWWMQTHPVVDDAIAAPPNGTGDGGVTLPNPLKRR